MALFVSNPSDQGETLALNPLHLYFLEGAVLKRLVIGAPSATTIGTFPSASLYQIAVWEAQDYCLAVGNGACYKMVLSTGAVSTLFSLADIRGVDIDPVGFKIYVGAGATVQRRDLGGVLEVSRGTAAVYSVKWSPAASMLYWTNTTPAIKRQTSALASDPPQLFALASANDRSALAVDHANSRLFTGPQSFGPVNDFPQKRWTFAGVATAIADGTISANSGVAYDPVGGRVYYWYYDRTTGVNEGRIMSVLPDGTDPQDHLVVSGITSSPTYYGFTFPVDP